jgi:hypothetical protein
VLFDGVAPHATSIAQANKSTAILELATLSEYGPELLDLSC